jgi:hypothetical protein
MKLRTLKDIIDYGTAPLVQWEPAIDQPLSEGKKHEDGLIYGSVIEELNSLGARNITGIVADESRLEHSIASALPSVERVTHLTLPGAFAKAANAVQQNAKTASPVPMLHHERVHVTSRISSIEPHSQDAVVMNMILGCLATAKDHDNLHRMLTFVATLLKPEGSMIIVRPNPAGGIFSTYKCTTPVCDLKGGEDYGFIVKGLEDLGEMQNLYTPDAFLRKHAKAAGLGFGQTKAIVDPTTGLDDVSKTEFPFLMNVCPVIR